MRTLIDFRDARVFAVPTPDGLRVGALVEGPQGWGEFSPPPDAGDALAARWLTAAMEPSTVGWPDAVRGSVPVAAVRVTIATSADLAHMHTVIDGLRPGALVRYAVQVGDVDATVALMAELTAAVPTLDIVELLCESAESVAAVRSQVQVPIAAAAAVLATAARPADVADAVVVSSGPLGGVRRALRRVELTRLPPLVNPAGLTSVAIAGDVALAAAIPDLRYPCGPVPSWLADADVVSPSRSLTGGDGFLPAAPSPAAPDPARLAHYEVTDPATVAHWHRMLQRAADAR